MSDDTDASGLDALGSASIPGGKNVLIAGPAMTGKRRLLYEVAEVVEVVGRLLGHRPGAVAREHKPPAGTGGFVTPRGERARMLVAFDFDGTLSDSEMTVLLGERCGVADEMAAITERAMNDEIGYAESLRERCRLLDGLADDETRLAFEAVRLRSGAADVLSALDAAGAFTAILTGGFERGVAAALDREGATADEVVANRLPVADGALTGAVEGPLVEGTKDDALEALAAREGVPMAETVAVGDGANDLPMLEVAGLAVGYDPKPAVEPACDVVVESMADLRTVLEDEGVLA